MSDFFFLVFLSQFVFSIIMNSTFLFFNYYILLLLKLFESFDFYLKTLLSCLLEHKIGQTYLILHHI